MKIFSFVIGDISFVVSMVRFLVPLVQLEALKKIDDANKKVDLLIKKIYPMALENEVCVFDPTGLSTAELNDKYGRYSGKVIEYFRLKKFIDNEIQSNNFSYWEMSTLFSSQHKYGSFYEDEDHIKRNLFNYLYECSFEHIIEEDSIFELRLKIEKRFYPKNEISISVNLKPKSSISQTLKDEFKSLSQIINYDDREWKMNSLDDIPKKYDSLVIRKMMEYYLLKYENEIFVGSNLNLVRRKELSNLRKAYPR